MDFQILYYGAAWASFFTKEIKIKSFVIMNFEDRIVKKIKKNFDFTYKIILFGKSDIEMSLKKK